MDTAREKWVYANGEKIWVGKYRNSKNMLHWHDECELIFVERGKMTVFTSGKNYDMSQGNAMFFDSRSLHQMTSVDESTLLLVMVFDRSIINEFAVDITLASPFIECGEAVSDAYRIILDELKNKQSMYNIVTSGTIANLMVKLFRSLPTAHKKPVDGIDDKFANLLCEIESNAEYYTLDDAAKFMNMNASYLSRMFSEKTGVHLIYYINCMRIQKAIKLIKTGNYSMTEISARCGFGTIRNFNDIFKKYTGYAPSALPKNYVFHATIDHPNFSKHDPHGFELVESSS
ncbi:MAG: AraC family transcriptional regulator [Clostridiales bacterium]|nr:AraC family transcriptional regulator [Clostridiales bacterium]